MEATTIANRVEQLQERVTELETQLKQAKARLAEMQPATEQAQKNVTFLEHQRLVVKGALTEAQFYLKQLAAEKVVEFPTTPEPEKMLEHRLGLDGIGPEQARAIRASNIQQEGLNWVYGELARRDNGTA